MDTKTHPAFNHSRYESCPFAMLVLDASGSIQWANSALEDMIGLPMSQLLGHNRDSIPSAAHRILFDEDETVHLQGSGVPDRWLECTTDLDNPDGQQLRIHFYRDVTRTVHLEDENQVLRTQIEQLRLSDELTGLPNQHALAQMLDHHVSLSRRYKNPLSVMLIQVRLSSIDIALEDVVKDPIMLAASHFLRDRFRWVDQISRWDQDTFAIILAETSGEAAEHLQTEVSASLPEMEIPETFQDRVQIDLDFGIASWVKGDDTKTLLLRTAKSLSTTAA